MKRPLAYITAPWSENEFENTENAAKYCRAVYDAGFSPVCPALFLPLFLRDEIPQEHLRKQPPCLERQRIPAVKLIGHDRAAHVFLDMVCRHFVDLRLLKTKNLRAFRLGGRIFCFATISTARRQENSILRRQAPIAAHRRVSLKSTAFI